jgi:NTE family protein
MKNADTYLPEFFPGLFGKAMSNMMTMTKGIPTFFEPNSMALFGPHASIGIENAAYYSIAPLRKTLGNLVDFDFINSRHTRVSLGAVNVRNGGMTYFDSREEPISIEHVLASGALPPAFPAIRIKDDYYWDGGVYSNTPIEAVLDDKPRHDSLIFAADVWNPDGAKPESLWQVAGREKDIRYASRTSSHIARQKQIHHLRHIISELAHVIPEKMRNAPEVKELISWGCKTQIHIARLLASELTGEDQLKDIDFTSASLHSRWKAGKEDTRRMLDLSPWDKPLDPVEGVIIHDLPTAVAVPIAAGPDGFAGKTK